MTGQKGIGFKSVFRVTDRPEIHSNGYHICFDVNSSPSGYILPHWIEADQEQHSSESVTGCLKLVCYQRAAGHVQCALELCVCVLVHVHLRVCVCVCVCVC